MLRELFNSGSDWVLVTKWLPFHFTTALLAWDLHEIIHAVDSKGSADPSKPGGPVVPSGSADSGVSASPSGSEGADAFTGDR